MLLSLVVIFTQSIQLSKIMERIASLRIHYRALGRLEHSCSRFNLRGAETQPQADIACLTCTYRTCQSRSYGGAERDRTVDPLLAKQVLSQLSYSPLKIINSNLSMTVGIKVVGLGRFELPTSPLSGVRSNQLSYRPFLMARSKSPLPYGYGLVNCGATPACI